VPPREYVKLMGAPLAADLNLRFLHPAGLPRSQFFVVGRRDRETQQLPVPFNRNLDRLMRARDLLHEDVFPGGIFNIVDLHHPVAFADASLISGTVRRHHSDHRRVRQRNPHIVLREQTGHQNDGQYQVDRRTRE